MTGDIQAAARSRQHRTEMPAWLYLTLVVGLTWLCWIPAALLPSAEMDRTVLVLQYLGGLMPFLVAVVLLYLHEPPTAIPNYWQRLVEVRRIGPIWALVALLVVPAITLMSVTVDRMLGGLGAVPDELARVTGGLGGWLTFTAFIFIFSPLPEELGWRGFVLDRLQQERGPLASGVILGAVWTLWHLPLFWIKGSYQHSLGIGTPLFWLFMLEKIPQSVIMTWIYNNTRRSTLAAVIVHFAVNLIGELYALTLRAESLYMALWWVLALGVSWGGGPLRLAGRRTPQKQRARARNPWSDRR